MERSWLGCCVFMVLRYGRLAYIWLIWEFWFLAHWKPNLRHSMTSWWIEETSVLFEYEKPLNLRYVLFLSEGVFNSMSLFRKHLKWKVMVNLPKQTVNKICTTCTFLAFVFDRKVHRVILQFPLCSLLSQRMSCVPFSVLGKEQFTNPFGIILNGTSFQMFDIHSTVTDAECLYFAFRIHNNAWFS
jgi:hypothetical protein